MSEVRLDLPKLGLRAQPFGDVDNSNECRFLLLILRWISDGKYNVPSFTVEGENLGLFCIGAPAVEMSDHDALCHFGSAGEKIPDWLDQFGCVAPTKESDG